AVRGAFAVLRATGAEGDLADSAASLAGAEGNQNIRVVPPHDIGRRRWHGRCHGGRDNGCAVRSAVIIGIGIADAKKGSRICGLERQSSGHIYSESDRRITVARSQGAGGPPALHNAPTPWT